MKNEEIVEKRKVLKQLWEEYKNESDYKKAKPIYAKIKKLEEEVGQIEDEEDPVSEVIYERDLKDEIKLLRDLQPLLKGLYSILPTFIISPQSWKMELLSVEDY